MSNSTITRCVLVTLLAFHFSGVCGSAQDVSPVRDEAKPIETTIPPAATPAVDPLAAAPMPDISGTWGVKIVEPKEMSSILGEMEIRRVQSGATDFLIDQPWGVRPTRVSVRWSYARQRFEGEWKEDESGEQSKITLQLLADKMKLRVIISSRIPTAKQSVDSDGSKDNETKPLVTQEWTRTSSSLSTTFDKNNVSYRQLTAAVSTEDSDETKTHADAPAKAVQTKVFRLANCSAVECGKLLKVFFDDRGITWDARTNSILVVSADEERMKAIEAILVRLDEAPSKQQAVKLDAFEKVREPTERLKVVHRHNKKLTTREAISHITIGGTDIIDVIQYSKKEIGVVGLGVGSTTLALWFDKNPQPRTILVTVTRESEAAELPKSPEARKLAEYVAEHEANAKLLADEVRGLSQQLGAKHPNLVETRRRLDEALANALAAKFKLEQLQITSLEERLTRLKAQIGQRQSLSKQIVERRARELIEGDALKWDSTGTAAEKGAEPAATSKPNAKLFNSVAASELTTQIHFTGPKGMEVLIAYEREGLIAPIRHSFLRHASETQRYSIGFIKIPGEPDLRFGALLDIFPSTPATDEFLRHNTVPITITDEDTRRASSELLIKVIYLPKPSSVKTAIPEVKTLLSTHISPGGDVIAAANQFGTILAVLRLAKDVDQLGKLEPKSSNTAITRPRLASQQDVKQEVAERSASSQSSAEPTALPSYQEFAKKLWTMDSSVSESEDALSRAERDAGNDLVIDTVPRARRLFDEAIRNRKAIQDEYAAVLRDLTLQVQSAELEAETAAKNTERIGKLVESGAAPQKELREAELRVKQTALALERLKVRFELYKKAGEQQPAKSVDDQSPVNERRGPIRSNVNRLSPFHPSR